MALTGDQIAGSICISLILLVMIHRLVSRQIAMGTVMRMALIWLIVILIAIVAVSLIQPHLHRDLT